MGQKLGEKVSQGPGVLRSGSRAGAQERKGMRVGIREAGRPEKQTELRRLHRPVQPPGPRKLEHWLLPVSDEGLRLREVPAVARPLSGSAHMARPKLEPHLSVRHPCLCAPRPVVVYLPRDAPGQRPHLPGVPLPLWPTGLPGPPRPSSLWLR